MKWTPTGHRTFIPRSSGRSEEGPDTDFPSEAELEARVASLRESAPRSRELVDAILDYVGAFSFRPPVVDPLVEEAIAVSEEIGYAGGKARALVPKAFLKLIHTRYSECIPIIAEAMPVLLEYRQTAEYARAMLVLATTSQTSGAYDQALDYCFRIVSDNPDQDEEMVAWMNYRIADVYRELGNTEEELVYASRCYEGFRSLCERGTRHQHRVGLGRACTALAAAFQSSGRLDEALTHNEIALEEYRRSHDRLGETRALNDLGRIHQIRGDAETAEKYLLEALKIRRDVGHVASQASSLLALGELYLERRNFEQAQSMLLEGLTIAGQTDSKMRAYEIHEALYRLYKVTGRTGQALRHHETFHALKEEAAGEAMNLKIHNREVLAEIDRAERDAAIERAKSEELRAKNEELAELLAELKATQDRLIQSEKMASLGQLTAGIAHEIRNPLNFVNNFSVMSAEIVAEMTEALGRWADRLDDGQKAELQDQLDTLVFNTARIREHGARADKIVANMIEHARTGNRQRARVDLNQLLEEYVVLAYHAQLASETGFPAFVYRNYDETAGDIDCVPQELGRVLLNLISNAFDALKDRGFQSGAPRITISSARIGPNYEIRISDNGPGIPDEIKSRIFEPFFTTKPTGLGTGLGLSMSYDIITKGHGGQLRVVSSPGFGATFVINLPAA